MEYIILAFVALLAILYLFSFFKKGLTGDCACKGASCNVNCKSRNACNKKID